ncbi:MAG: hypothetical protein P4L82_05615 [Ancalomicrobiaceae bacterium]|nr:hypothetical protein [Ancalomicrobiaceae bacterium]
MTLSEVIEVLKAGQVPDYLYAVDSLGDGDCVGIAFTGGRWTTYFSERGARVNVKEFDSEAAACAAFLADVAGSYEAYFGRKPDLHLNG